MDLIARHQPELVFLDVEMRDGTGFDLLQRVGKPGFNVIFTTGFAQYAITAIKFGALDFLLKPVSADDLAIALQRAREKNNEKLSARQLEILSETLRLLPEKKLLPHRDTDQRGIIYKTSERYYQVEANQSYTEFFCERPEKVVASVNIGSTKTSLSCTGTLCGFTVRTWSICLTWKNMSEGMEVIWSCRWRYGQ
ncbi:MAG: response regulator [Saprospirales bacterium]|nr:response regulator [Saprospirales bacterium]